MSGVCERSKTALMEVALGGAAPPALAAHLEGCAPCRAWLADQRRLIGRIDAELRASLRVEPSPAFLAQVRQRVDAASVAPRWWRIDRLVSAAIAVVVLFAAFVRFAGRPSEPLATPTSTRSEGARALGPAPRSPSPERPITVAAARAAVRVERTHAAPREPEVLVPPGQEALLRRFIEPIRRGRVDAASLLSAETAEPVELKTTDIEPIEIKPLAIEPTNEEES
jgi:hypothetical protein